MKKEKLGSYIVISNKRNSKHIATFKNARGEVEFTRIVTEVKEVFIKEKREEKSQKNEFDRYIEHLPLTEYQLNEKATNKIKSAEEEFFANEGERRIIREIWNLPVPQNRRAYMKIVDGFSLTEIAKIEQCDVSAIKRSIDVAIKKLQKKLKNF